MPTYTVTVTEDRLSAEQKARIAAAITRTHHEITGAPAYFAQVIVNELRAGNYFVGGAPLEGDQIFVHGEIRAGRSSETKRSLIQHLIEAVAREAGVASTRVWVYILKLPAEQMAEFGRILPPPGKETDWIASFPDAERERMKNIGSR